MDSLPPSLDWVERFRAFGARPALQDRDAAISYEALAEHVAKQVADLANLGLAPGDRCAFVCGEDPVTVIQALALLELGCVVLPLSSQLGAEELRQAQRAFDAKWSASAAGPIERLGTTAEGRCRTAVAFAEPPVQGLLSSGSTGAPKIVLRSARQLHAYTEIYAAGLRLSPKDRVAVLLPFSFAYGFNSLMLGTLAAGASLVFPGSRHPRRVMTAIRASGVTILASTPTFLELMVRYADGANDDLADVRVCIATGEPLSTRIAARFAETFGKTLWNNYGSSETGPMTVDRRQTADGDAIALGRPYPGVEIRLRDEQGEPVPEGEPGEIVVCSPAVGLGYASPAGGIEAFEGGRFATGDLGVLRDGVLFFVGRRKLLVQSAGRKVDPIEVEHALRRHPQVVDAAVVGHREDDRETIRAIVVAEGDVTAGELLAFCSESLASYKLPRLIEFRASLPRNESGKLLRTRL